MPTNFLAALAAVVDRLRVAVEKDADLKAGLVSLGHAIGLAVNPAPAPPDPEPVPAPMPVLDKPPPPPPFVPAADRISATEAVSRLTFLQAKPADSSAAYVISDHAGWDPQAASVISDRMRIKADACRLMEAKCRGQVWAADAVPALQARADKHQFCALWMIMMGGLSDAAAVWVDLAGAYTSGAAAAELMAIVVDPVARVSRDQLTLALNLAAEAQATLFAAVIDTGNLRADADQIQLYVTIRELARDEQIYIPKYLRREDRADPRNWADVNARLMAATEPLSGFRRKAGDLKKTMNNLKYKLKVAADDGESFGEWPRVVELIDEAVMVGLPPSNAELRTWLLPVFDNVPDEIELPRNAARVFQEVEKYVELSAVTADSAKEMKDRWSEDVLKVAKHVKGRSMVLIGGQVRPDRRDALIRAFGLADLFWMTTPEHSSITVFEPMIMRPETAVVLLAIRWSNHDYADVNRYCVEYDKLMVRLPGGYHPNQVAHQILTQVGDRLEALGVVAETLA